MAVEPVRRVARFGTTERRLHRVHAIAFALLLASGLVLFVPFVAQVVSNRPLVKAVHLAAAAGWLTALALVVVLGDRAALTRTRREVERFDADDLLWLRRRPVAQGRFNAGQKLHAMLQAGLAVLFTASGTLLWLGERDTALRLPGTLALHDASTLLVMALVTGHVWMAYARPESLEAIRRGTVSADYAAHEHAKWQPGPAPADDPPSARAPRLAGAALVVAAGLAAMVLLVSDVLGG